MNSRENDWCLLQSSLFSQILSLQSYFKNSRQKAHAIRQNHLLLFLLIIPSSFSQTTHWKVKLLPLGSWSISISIPVNTLGDFSKYVDGPFNNLSSQSLDLFIWNAVFSQSTSIIYSQFALDLIMTFNTSKSQFQAFCSLAITLSFPTYLSQYSSHISLMPLGASVHCPGIFFLYIISLLISILFK